MAGQSDEVEEHVTRLEIRIVSRGRLGKIQHEISDLTLTAALLQPKQLLRQTLQSMVDELLNEGGTLEWLQGD